jgi:hypothetical protein
MTLGQFLKDIREAQQIGAQAFAHVEWADDPAVPGKRAYSIGGTSLEAVQTEIDRHMRVVEIAGGNAEFLNPMPLAVAGRKYGADKFMEAPFVSLGYTIIGAVEEAKHTAEPRDRYAVFRQFVDDLDAARKRRGV